MPNNEKLFNLTHAEHLCKKWSPTLKGLMQTLCLSVAGITDSAMNVIEHYIFYVASALPSRTKDKPIPVKGRGKGK